MTEPIAPPIQEESTSVTVAVRCRPFNERERLLGNAETILQYSEDHKSLVLSGGNPDLGATATANRASHPFTFDHSYPETVGQEQIFIDVGLPVLKATYDGYNTCIFAYGQTGSGKSYAMMGPGGGREATKDPGLIPRICTKMFEDIRVSEEANVKEMEEKKDLPEIERPAELHYSVEVTYLEIYQEKVKCLLNPRKDGLRVRQHPVLGVFVDDLTQIGVKCYPEVFDLIEGGNNVRHVSSTAMNERSSRSHAIFTLIVKQTRTSYTKLGKQVSERKARVNLVDLAGSERAKSTMAEGDTLREGSNINKSLTTLGLVISGLAELSKGGPKKPFIPFRDSTLTWLLKENLGGNSKTFMLSTISPAHVNYEETLSTLRYADRAKAIVTKAKVNEDPQVKYIRELKSEIEQLKAKMEEFEQERERIQKPSSVPSLNLGKVTPMPKQSIAAASGPAAKKGALRGPRGPGAGGAKAGLALPIVTPRTAISQVTYADETNDPYGDAHNSGSDDGYGSDSLMDTTTTPRDQSQADVLRHRAEMSEKLLGQLMSTEEDREKKQEEEIAERAEAMKQVEVTVKAHRDDPYLLNIDNGGDWVMEYLIVDVTYLGSDAPPEDATLKSDVRYLEIPAEGVAPKHCCFIKNSNSSVLVRPIEGETFVDDAVEPITGETVIYNGQTVQLGDEVNLKYVCKSAPLMSSRRSMRMTMRKASSPMMVGSASAQSSGNGSELSPLSISPLPIKGLMNSAIRDGFDNNNNNANNNNDQQEQRESTPPQQQVHQDPVVPPLAFGKLGGFPSGSSSASTSSTTGPPTQPGGIGGMNLPSSSSSVISNQPQRIGTGRSGATVGPLSGRSGGGGGGGTVSGGGAVRTPRITTSTLSTYSIDEMTAHNSQTCIVLGACGSGKSAFKACLGKDLRFWESKKVPPTAPTFGFDISSMHSGTITKTELRFVEISGNESMFNLLIPMIPEQRVVFVLCFRLIDPVDVQMYRRYIEAIQARATTSECTIVLVGTHRDGLRAANEHVLEQLAEAQTHVTNFLKMLEPNENRRPQVAMRFAVSCRDRTVLSHNAKITKFSDLLQWFAEHGAQRCKMDAQFPHALVPIRAMTLARRVVELKAQGKWMVPSSEYRAIAKLIDPRYEKNVEDLLKHTQLLHAWMLLHHHYRHMFLKKYVMVDPEWVFRVLTILSCCITPHAGALRGESQESNALSPGQNVDPEAERKNSLDRFAAAGSQQQPSGAASATYTSSATHGYFPQHVLTYASQNLPFNTADVRRADPNNLLPSGVITNAIAMELYRSTLAEKNYSCQSINLVMDLLEKYEVVMKAKKVMMSPSEVHKGSRTLARNASREHDEHGENRSGNSSADFSRQTTAAPSGSASLAPSTNSANLAQHEEQLEGFYVIPACFSGKVPGPVTMHIDPLLMGLCYRFSLNTVPQLFFPRLIVRISSYVQQLYLGPCERSELMSGAAQFWANCVWVYSGVASRALVRMVHRSLFVTFHDYSQDFTFQHGLREIIRSLVNESPGVRCDESEQCPKCDYWKSLQIISLQPTALNTARGPPPSAAEEQQRQQQQKEASMGVSGHVECINCGFTPPQANTPEYDDLIAERHSTFDAPKALESIKSETFFISNETQHRFEIALKEIKVGREMEDHDEGTRVEGFGLDALVDAMAQA